MEESPAIQQNLESIVATANRPETLDGIRSALAQAAQEPGWSPISTEQVVHSAIEYVLDSTIPHWNRVASSSPEDFWSAVESLAGCGINLSREPGGAELVPCYDEESQSFTLVPLPGPANLEHLLNSTPFVSDVVTEVESSGIGEGSVSTEDSVLRTSSKITLANGEQIVSTQTFVPILPAYDEVDLEKKASQTVLHSGIEKLTQAHGAEAPLLQQALLLEAACHMGIMKTAEFIASNQQEKVTSKHFVLEQEQAAEGESEGPKI